VKYVLDVSTINAISLDVPDPELVFDRLTDLVKEGTVCFSNEVIDELKRLAEGELAYTWAKAAGTARREKGAPYDYVQWVADNVRDLVDEYAEYESAAPTVLAQACYLKADGQEVCVVTEDIRDKPTRISLGSGCAQAGIRSIRLQQFLEELNNDE
jgi:Domain of unknown function (DUF4411)